MVIFVLFFEKILRRFFIGLDSVLFNFISTLYDLLMEISRTTILSQGEIARLAQRIELLLGIFMLFKLSFSLITYIVNPDDFSDKQKGFGKLIQSAVISLLMLVLVPYIFQMAFNLQTKILEGNILAKLIMGEDTGDDSYLNSAGDDMAFDVMLPFFLPNTGLKSSDLSACITIYDSNGDFSKDCEDALTKTGINNVTLHNYITGISERSLGLTFRSAMVIETPKDIDDEFIIDYKLLISTVVAVVVCLLLVTFCIDIGVRSVKLAFLQLIYPIPVISYMDPKSGKDGLFKKWYKMCFSTFLSLFVRLLALYFGIYIIYRVGQVGMYDVITGAQKTGFWLQVFIIIGVLMFVKQLPKILENMGIKLDGDGKFTLNPLKKFAEGAVGGKQILAAGAAGLAGAAALGANGLTTAQRLKNAKGFRGKAGALFGGIGSMVAGGTSALSRGLIGAGKGEKFGKNFSNSYSTAMKNKQSRADRKDDDVSWGEMMVSKAQQKTGIHTQGEKAKAKIDALSRMTKLKDQANNIADKSDSTIKDLLRQKEAISKIDPQSLIGSSYSDSSGTHSIRDLDDAIKRHSAMIKEKDDEIDTARANYFRSEGAKKGSSISSIYEEMSDIAQKYNQDINDGFSRTGSTLSADTFNPEDIKAAGTAAINAQQAFEQSSDARHAQTVDKYGAKKDQK